MKHFSYRYKIPFKLLVLFLALTCFSGCRYSKENLESLDLDDFNYSNMERGYDLYIFNLPEQPYSDAFAEMCKDYEAETGVKIKVFSPPSEQDYIEAFKNEANSKNKPTIFMIKDVQQFKKLENSKLLLDLSKEQEDKFGSFVNEIPPHLRLSTNGKNILCVPFGIQAYGYIINKQILYALIDKEPASLLDDLKNSSYQEFEKFVKMLANYLKDSKLNAFTLSGNKYSFAAAKSSKASSLSSIFATAGQKSLNDVPIIPATDAVFVTQMDASQATAPKLHILKNPLIKYAEAIELQSAYCKKEDTSSDDQINSIKDFIDGKILLLEGGTWTCKEIQSLNPELDKHLHFLPIKIPITQDDIKISGLSAEKFRNSISVFAKNYYAINAQASKLEQKLAQDFLIWLQTSELGQDYLINKLKLLPYAIAATDIEQLSKALPNSFGASILDYERTGNILPASCLGAPSTWSENLKDWLKVQENTPENFANYAIHLWKKLGDQGTSE